MSGSPAIRRSFWSTPTRKFSRLRLTLAHKAAHLILHQTADGPNVEEEANRFAGEFLMPRREIKASLYRLNLAKLLDLKQEWKVSMAAIVFYAHRLGTITPAQYRYLNINLQRRWGFNEPYEDQIPVEKPTLVQGLVNVHQRVGVRLGRDVSYPLLFQGRRFRRRIQRRQPNAHRLIIGTWRPRLTPVVQSTADGSAGCQSAQDDSHRSQLQGLCRAC